MPRSKNTHPIIPTVTLRPALNDGAINKMLHHGPSATNADMKAEHGFDKRFTQSALYVDNKRKRHANLWRLFKTSVFRTAFITKNTDWAIILSFSLAVGHLSTWKCTRQISLRQTLLKKGAHTLPPSCQL